MFTFASLLALTSLSLASAVDVVSGPEWSTLKTAILAQPGAKVSKLQAFAEPPVPEGFTEKFGPLNASTTAPGYMGFVFMDSYDVAGCANICKARDPDPTGGLCRFFNIFQAETTSGTTTFSCSMYYLSTDNTTATNAGDSTVKISNSRGYRRQSLNPDPSFEGFDCYPPALFCSTALYNGWAGTSPDPYVYDQASIVRDPEVAHFGLNAMVLGSLSGKSTTWGIEFRNDVYTTRGRNYTVAFFHSNTQLNPANASLTNLIVSWNADVLLTISGPQNWTFHQHTVTGTGGDTLSFQGGRYPAFDCVDDVYIYLL